MAMDIRAGVILNPHGSEWPTHWTAPDGSKIPLAAPVVVTGPNGEHVAIPQVGVSLMSDVVMQAMLEQITFNVVNNVMRNFVEALADRCSYTQDDGACNTPRAVHGATACSIGHDFVEPQPPPIAYEADGQSGVPVDQPQPEQRSAPTHDPFNENGEASEDVDDNAPDDCLQGSSE